MAVVVVMEGTGVVEVAIGEVVAEARAAQKDEMAAAVEGKFDQFYSFLKLNLLNYCRTQPTPATTSKFLFSFMTS